MLAYLKSLEESRPKAFSSPIPKQSMSARKVSDFIAAHASKFYSSEEIATVTRLTARAVAFELKVLGYVQRRGSVAMPVRFKGRRVWVLH